MKTKIGTLLFAFCAIFFNLQAQRVITTARAKSYDISDNLDLKAVATIFGESDNLQDFEQRLNDPDAQISNLDLNQDGYVDYLRVIESTENGLSEVVIQAVLGDDVFQDVATIDVERLRDGNPRVQIIGDSYLYGPDYIFEPVFVRTPLIFSFFWSSDYRPWHSPYYWGYYPPRFHYWRPCSTHRYMRNVNVHVNIGNSFNFNVARRIHEPDHFQNNFRRDDYARTNPDRSFSRRNEGYKNKTELNHRRPSDVGNNIGMPNDRQGQRQRPVSVRNQPERRVFEKRPSEPVRQPRQNNVITRPNNRVEKQTNAPVSTQKAESGHNRNRTTQQVRPEQRTERKQVIEKRKESRKEAERRRRTE